VVKIVFGRRRFSSEFTWEDMGPIVEAAGGPRLSIECCDEAGLLDYLAHAEPDVVVPITALVGAAEMDAGRFRLIQQFGVGLDNVDVESATRRDIWVGNMPGLNAPEVAEHAILLLLALLRRLPDAGDGFVEGGWGRPPVRSLPGCRICIVGFGAIGAAIAERLRAFGADIVAVTRRPELRTGSPDFLVLGFDQLEEVAATADAVILAAAHEPGQSPVVDQALLHTMRPDSVLVNVGRGGLIDDEALVRALDEGEIEAAGLDVFRNEPIGADHPLVRHPRTICTAHIAALTARYFHEAARELGEAISALLANQPPPNAVNSPRS
jgi:phosphoglycerate dehydrogenase-like enzyme